MSMQVGDATLSRQTETDLIGWLVNTAEHDIGYCDLSAADDRMAASMSRQGHCLDNAVAKTFSFTRSRLNV